MKCIIIFTILLRLCFLLVGVRADPRNTLVVDKQGRVYFGDVLHNTVWKIQDGKLTPFLKDKHSHRVVLDEQGNLCLRDGSGTVRVKLGATPTGAGLILFDQDVEPAIWASTDKSSTSLKLLEKGKAHRILKP